MDELIYLNGFGEVIRQEWVFSKYIGFYFF